MSFQQSASEWHGMDANVGVPYDTYVDRGRGVVVRVDTDGNGGLVEQVIGPAPPLAKPGEFGTPAELREELRRLTAEKENAELRYSEMKREVLRMLRMHGPATKDAIADHARVWVCQAGSALHDLSRKGLAECWTDPAARQHKYLWGVPE